MAGIRFVPQGGGSINEAYRVETPGGNNFFLKLNANPRFSKHFEREKNGLDFLSCQEKIRVPCAFDPGAAGNAAFLLMEWVPPGTRNRAFWESLGKGLAGLHQVTSDRFGFHEDNFIGALPQANPTGPDWVQFFADFRLRPLVTPAAEQGLIEPETALQFEKLYSRLADYFDTEPPALLHGDLWSGNFLCDSQSRPVLIDPAVYFGHRSMDLAMTTLFGGFDRLFYESYNYYYPFPANYREQWELCNLYPLLVHLHLFGASYLPAIRATLRCYC